MFDLPPDTPETTLGLPPGNKAKKIRVHPLGMYALGRTLVFGCSFRAVLPAWREPPESGLFPGGGELLKVDDILPIVAALEPFLAIARLCESQ